MPIWVPEKGDKIRFGQPAFDGYVASVSKGRGKATLIMVDIPLAYLERPLEKWQATFDARDEQHAVRKLQGGIYDFELTKSESG